MGRIVGSSVKFPRAVLAVALAVMVVGVWQLDRAAKVDAGPEFAPPTVEVQTEALGLSAEEVEQLITVPMEQDLLDGVAWLDRIESKSVPGLSSIRMVFDEGTDLYRARQVVQERISQAAGLPNVSKPPQMLQPQSSTARVGMISLSSKTLNPVEIGVLARWTIRPRLLAVPGVASVAIWGQRERQLQVQVDPQRLAYAHVTLEQVISSTGNGLWVSPLTFLEASTPGTGGFIDTPNQRLGIQHNLPIIGPDDLGALPIEETDGAAPATIDDVATVVEDHQPLIGDALVTGSDADRAGFMLVVEKLPGANTPEVAAGVDEALAELQPGLRGVHVDPTVFEPASYVQRSVDRSTQAVIVGGLLLAALLLLVLFSWRAALTAFLSIAVSITVAAWVLHLFDQVFTPLLFAGLLLALLAVVDDALTTVTGITRALRDRASESAGRADAVREAASGSVRTIGWATVIFALAVTPIFLMDGLSGDAFFPPAATAGLVALVASLVVSATLAPVLGLVLLTDTAVRRSSPVLERLQRGYQRSIGPVVRHPLPTFALAGVVVIVGVLVLPGLHASLLPQPKDTNVMVRWDAPFGTSLGEMNRITARAAAEIRALPGVRNVGGQVGQAVLGDQPVGADSAAMWVRLDPAADYDTTISAVERVAGGYPGIHHQVLTYTESRMQEVLGRTSDEVTLRIFGDDLDVLHEKAGEARDLLTRIDGVDAARVTTRPAEPTMEVEVDIARAREVGIKPGDVRRAAATLLSGLRVGSLFEDQKVFDVVVWTRPEARRSVTSVENLLVDTPSGGSVRLGDVAAVRVRPTPPVIEHQDISRYVDVAADVSGRDPGAVAAELRTQLRTVAFPLEYHAEILGDYEEQQGAQRQLLGFVIAAAIGIFLLLQAAFSSWRLAIVAFLALLVALSGGVVAARIDGDVVTLASVVGLLAVLAFALRSVIALVDRMQRLRADEGMELGSALVARATSDRLVPTVGTALATAAALLPLAVMGAGAGLEIANPMAFVALGGLLTATLTSLFVVPAAYLRFAPERIEPPLDLETELDLTELDRTDGDGSGHVGELATVGGPHGNGDGAMATTAPPGNQDGAVATAAPPSTEEVDP